MSPRLGLLNACQASKDAEGTIKAAEALLAVDLNHLSALYAVAWGSFQAKNFRRPIPPIAKSSRSTRRTPTR
ncbi:MAG: hypothetical protein U1F77_06545 [Kiritimatiellia bacterium]